MGMNQAKVAALVPTLQDEEIVKEDGKTLVRFAPPDCTTLSDVITVFLYHMLPFTPVPVILLGLLEWHLHSTYGWMGTAGFITGFIILATLPLSYSKKARNDAEWLYIAMARYMEDVKVLVPGKQLERQEPHIFAFHPHGRMFYTCSLMIQTHHRWGAPFMPKGDFFGAAAGGFFAVPLLRHWLYAIGAIPADKKAIVSKLRKKQHVSIIVGGVKEVCLGTNSECDELYLKNRKGFIKIAVEQQIGVVPIYCFNENELFKHDSKAKLKFWEKVNKYVNIGVPFMRGVWNLPMPFRRELLVVVGDPLYPKQGETVDELHARYVTALEELFARYVKLSPHPDHKLIIS